MNNKNTFSKIWEVFKPFLIYYILYNVVFVLLLSLCRAVAEGLGEEYMTALTEHVNTVTGLVSGLSMLIGVLPLLPILREEVREHRRSVHGTSATQDHESGGEKGAESGKPGITAAQTVLTILLAAASSLGLNVFLALTGLVDSSAAYQEVAERQYGVVLGLGLLLYGVVSPITEEIIFRGLIFNRMRRYMPHAAAVIVSGVLFGIYHGNWVQGLYGGCMGILMAYLYERTHSFFTPCLFHATANLVVYTTAQNASLQGLLFTIPGCAALFMISIVCVAVIERRA